MEKNNVLFVSTVIFGLVLSSFGTALTSQVVLAKENQSWHRQAPAPVHATNIKVVKKVFIPEDIRAIKGKPTNPRNSGKNKTKEGMATGTLGDYPITGTKYAVVIGICDYPGTKYDLCTSDGDSLHMYEALTTLYGYLPKNIYLFKDMGGATGNFYNEIVASTDTPIGNKSYSEPTRRAIYEAIKTIKGKVASDADNNGLTDEVTFFFSGHGTSGNADDGDGELTDEAIVVHDNDSVDGVCSTTPDTDDGNQCLDFIWDGELRKWFSGFATSRINFIFDSCLAGGMNDVATDGRVVSMATDETHSAHVYSSDKYNIRTSEMKDVDNDIDGTLDGEGVFTHYFANEGMLQGLANVHDYNSNDILKEPEQTTIEESFYYTKSIIPHWLKQKPVLSDNFTDDLLL